MIELPFDENINIRILENVFDDMTNSYKIFWFLGVFEEIINNKITITFKEVVARMIEKAWYPLLNYNLNFGPQDQMSKNVKKIYTEHIKDKNIINSKLYRELCDTENKEIEKIMKEFYRYVPYRLLRGFYKKELRGVKDGIINKSIEELASNDNKVFYKINTLKQEIYINENWYNYIRKNQNIIRGWANYNLILFLQSRNPSVPAIPLKLEPPIERNLTVAKKYWNTVIENIHITDIYTGEPFNIEKYNENGPLSIDHFLPWSFIGHDELWNLVPTFRNINSSKNDSLPKYDVYIEDFSEIQFKAINFMRSQKNSKKYLQEYLSIDKNLDIKEVMSVNGELNKDKFIRNLKSAINPLYQIAYNQGFNEWTYNISNKGIFIENKELEGSIIIGSNLWEK